MPKVKTGFAARQSPIKATFAPRFDAAIEPERNERASLLARSRGLELPGALQAVWIAGVHAAARGNARRVVRGVREPARLACLERDNVRVYVADEHAGRAERGAEQAHARGTTAAHVQRRWMRGGVRGGSGRVAFDGVCHTSIIRRGYQGPLMAT